MNVSRLVAWLHPRLAKVLKFDVKKNILEIDTFFSVVLISVFFFFLFVGNLSYRWKAVNAQEFAVRIFFYERIMICESQMLFCLSIFYLFFYDWNFIMCFLFSPGQRLSPILPSPPEFQFWAIEREIFTQTKDLLNTQKKKKTPRTYWHFFSSKNEFWHDHTQKKRAFWW